MNAVLRATGSAVAEHKVPWAAVTTGFVLLYQLALLAALVLRFENTPNYVTVYNYPANVLEILANTPALTDAIDIIEDEWLIEIGYMNYDYGNGISEWSLTVLPTKLLILFLVGALVATCIVLLLPDESGACKTTARGRTLAATGGGAALVGLSSATLSWVVCCATPTWVVGLAMLGMSASLALWLEPFGQIITVSGFALLTTTIIILARRRIAVERAYPGGSLAVDRSVQSAP